jgi:hypothetical protein
MNPESLQLQRSYYPGLYPVARMSEWMTNITKMILRYCFSPKMRNGLIAQQQEQAGPPVVVLLMLVEVGRNVFNSAAVKGVEGPRGGWCARTYK